MVEHIRFPVNLTGKSLAVFEKKHHANKKNAEVAQRFFKTGPGEYAEGDRFLGIRVPVLRKLAREYQTIAVEEAEHLLKSPIHEERLLSLFILIRIYSKGGEAVKKEIYELYLSNTRFINNWDLVDASAEHIVGGKSRYIDSPSQKIYGNGVF